MTSSSDSHTFSTDDTINLRGAAESKAASDRANDFENIRPRGVSHVRHVMVLLATLVAVLLYLDRVCLSTASNAFGKDLGISSAQVDQVLGAFFWMYALGQLPAGWLGDRFGARWMLGSYIILWSLVTALMGIANTLTVAWILRMACGLFEAGAYPLAASIVRRWVPLRSRGKASALIAIGGRLGGAVAPVLTIQLMLLWTYGRGWASAPDDAVAAITSWRPVMMLYGIVGIIIAIIFMWWFRDWPHLHPAVSEDELARIREGDTAPPVSKSASEFPPIMAMVGSFPMWMNCFVQFAANIGWGFLVTKMPQFLQQAYNTTQQSQGWLQSLPLAAGIIGMFLGGLFTDSLTSTFGLRWGRSLALAISRVIVTCAFLSIHLVDTAVGATLCLAVVGLATDLGTPAVWAFGQDVGGRYVGSAVGWANMWGNFGAALSPQFFGLFVGATAGAATGAIAWNHAFTACAVVNLIAAFAALGINASKPLRVDGAPNGATTNQPGAAPQEMDRTSS